MAASAICKIKHEACGQDVNKHKAKLSALLASRQCAMCFILRMAKVRPCFNYFKELMHEHLAKGYTFRSITHLSTSLSWVR